MKLIHRLLLPLALFAAAMPAMAQEAPKAGAGPLTAEAKAKIIAGMTNVVKSYAFVPGVDFNKWDDYIKSKTADIDKAATDDELSEVINGGVSTFFGTSHLVLITPKAAQARRDRSAVGIGIRIEPLDEGGLRVIKVFPDTPAQRAGLQPGDVVLEADGKKLEKGMTFQGAEGTIVELTVKRDDKMMKFKVERKKYSIEEPDTLTWIDNDTAVLQVHTFLDSYSANQIEKLMTEAQRAKKLIVDLRGNGGGIVANMMNLIGYFIEPSETFGFYVNRAMTRAYEKETMGDPTDLKKVIDYIKPSGMKSTKNKVGQFKGEIAVLVNGGSGSASEITAMALKEFRNAPVVGTKSAGAVLVSTMAPIGEGWQVQYPFMDYISAKGVRLEGTGIKPDAEAQTPRFGEKDTAIGLAIALIDKKAGK